MELETSFPDPNQYSNMGEGVELDIKKPAIACVARILSSSTQTSLSDPSVSTNVDNSPTDPEDQALSDGFFNDNLDDEQVAINESTSWVGGPAGAESRMAALQQRAAKQGWAITPAEVDLSALLFANNKNEIHVAKWRGQSCVSKVVKVANRGNLRNEDSDALCPVDQLVHEIGILSSLKHPDILRFMGANLETQPYFMVTEHMEGGDMETHFYVKSQTLGRPYCPPHFMVVRWASAITRALAYLHAVPVIHRDLKPLNLLLSKDFKELKVMDFGISCAVNASGYASGQARPLTGGLGTLRYIAPEVARHEPYTDRIDVYAFGLILYFMCSGKGPFSEIPDAVDVLKAFSKGKEIRPHLTSQLGDENLRRLMVECWAVKPKSRPAAEECVKRLQQRGPPPEQINCCSTM